MNAAGLPVSMTSESNFEKGEGGSSESPKRCAWINKRHVHSVGGLDTNGCDVVHNNVVGGGADDRTLGFVGSASLHQEIDEEMILFCMSWYGII